MVGDGNGGNGVQGDVIGGGNVRERLVGKVTWVGAGTKLRGVKIETQLI